MAPQGRGNSIRVRVYRPEDYKQVIKVFYEGMAYGPGSPADYCARTLYKHPLSGFVYLVGAIFAWLIARTNYLPLSLRAIGILSVAGVVLSYLRWVRRRSITMMEGYCEQCLREDLKDITAHYRLEPKNSDNGHHESEYKPTKSSCFWVAEQKSDSGTGYEVVGCIALDAPDAPSVGELRRLSVLPNQRGKGIGSLLIRTVIAFAKEQKNLSSLRLTTSTFQPDGIRLYTRYGWKNTEMKAYKGNVMESLFYLVTMEYYDL